MYLDAPFRVNNFSLPRFKRSRHSTRQKAVHFWIKLDWKVIKIDLFVNELSKGDQSLIFAIAILPLNIWGLLAFLSCVMTLRRRSWPFVWPSIMRCSFTSLLWGFSIKSKAFLHGMIIPTRVRWIWWSFLSDFALRGSGFSCELASSFSSSEPDSLRVYATFCMSASLRRSRLYWSWCASPSKSSSRSRE